MVLPHGAAPGCSSDDPEQATVTSASPPPPLPQALQQVLLCPFQVTSVDLGSKHREGWTPVFLAWETECLALKHGEEEKTWAWRQLLPRQWASSRQRSITVQGQQRRTGAAVSQDRILQGGRTHSSSLKIGFQENIFTRE